ncbi:unnamed protein product [Absidia cylindrospora]
MAATTMIASGQDLMFYDGTSNQPTSFKSFDECFPITSTPQRVVASSRVECNYFEDNGCKNWVKVEPLYLRAGKPTIIESPVPQAKAIMCR